MESYTEDPRSWILNQEVIEGILHRSLLLDHKTIKEGIKYHEKKELQTIYYEDGVESNLSHMRSIGNQTYTTNQKFVDEEVKDETIETNLAEDKIAAFKKDWKDNCQLPNMYAIFFAPNDWPTIHRRHENFLQKTFLNWYVRTSENMTNDNKDISIS